MEATAHLPNSEQGGPTLWKVLMDLVIATSQTAMHCIINKIATVKLSDFNGEDVTQCTTFLRSSYTLLKNHDRIPVDMIYLLFQTLRECSTLYFVRRVEYCEHNRLSKIRTQWCELIESLELFLSKNMGHVSTILATITHSMMAQICGPTGAKHTPRKQSITLSAFTAVFQRK